MVLADALKYGREELGKAKIEAADIDAWLLLEFATHVNRADYFGNPKKEMTEEEWQYYRRTIAQRKKRIPLQHITGVQEFMGLVFRVNENVLVPRQDTEVLVEYVNTYVEPGMNILDMCTGSGCIAISLKKFHPSCSVTGVDVSQSALEVARENGCLNEVECEWIHSNLFEKITEKYDIIVSNPPYVKTSVIQELEDEVRIHDPILALDGKEDGLWFYRKIIEETSARFLRAGGMLFFEIGHDQGQEVSEYMLKFGFCNIEIKKDLAGFDRVVYGVRK